MAERRSKVICPIDPIGLKRDEAAAYVRFSEAIFDRMVEQKLMPDPRQFGKLLVWDVDELTSAFKALPKRGGLQAEPPQAQTQGEDDVEFKL